MKIISGEAQKKIEQRMESLEQQVANLTGLSGSLEQQRAALEARLREAEEKLSESIDTQAGLQSDLKAVGEAKQEVERKLAEQRATTEKLKEELAKAGQQLTQRQGELKASQEQATKQSQNAKAELEKLKVDAEGQRSMLKKELEKLKTESAAQREQSQKDLDKQKSELSTLLKKYRELQAKQQDSAQENELLILQLTQAQEELLEYYDDKTRLEKLYETYKARWERLEKRHPNYVDFGALELQGFDLSSEVPSITLRLKDYAHAGVSLPEFVFRIGLQDGHPGIGLVGDGSLKSTKDSTVVPQLLATHRPQAARFLRMGNTEQRQLTAALVILAQMEANQWKGFDFPKGLDIGFWRPFIKQLIAQWAALPPLLRYDSVKLKRELINPDYEHLWIELHGVAFDKQSWKKLELRLGAALVEPEGFSKFPKLEIPLIDGKTKPFESWYPESRDDSGEKLELRFSVEKKVFDAGVLARLTAADRNLVIRLVYSLQGALQQLEDQKVAIHRPWKTWIDFAGGAVQVIELNRRAAPKSAKTVKAAIPEPQPSLNKEQPAKLVPVRAGAMKTPVVREPRSKVINVSTAPKKQSVGKTVKLRPSKSVEPASQSIE